MDEIKTSGILSMNIFFANDENSGCVSTRFTHLIFIDILVNLKHMNCQIIGSWRFAVQKPNRLHTQYNAVNRTSMKILSMMKHEVWLNFQKYSVTEFRALTGRELMSLC